MRKYRVVLMVPQEHILMGDSPQAAHNQVTKMLEGATKGEYPHPSLHSIEEIEELEIEFEPDFSLE